MDDFGLWMKTRYLLKNLDDDTLRERQNELLDVLGGLRRIISIFVDSLARDTLLSLCDLLYPSDPQIDVYQINSFQSLPDEMLHLVCNCLNVIDLKNLQCASCQLAIISRQQLSARPALNELNNNENNEMLKCSIGFKQDILSLIQTENINTKFLHLSSLISSNMNKYELLIKHGIIGKLVEFIKYDNKKCNFKYKYEAMKILIELITYKDEQELERSQHLYREQDQFITYNNKYLEEICSGYDVLSSFHTLCQSDPVSKLLHYTSIYAKNDHYDTEVDLNKNDKSIMETDDDIIGAYRWDNNAKKWRECGDGKGRVAIYQNIQTGMHKFMFINNHNIKLLQYVDNMQGVTWNSHDCSIYWRGDDYCMHTNGTWKFIFDHLGKSKYIQQAIQLHDCFTTYSSKDNQSVGAKIITQLDSNNIFDHFYWLTLPLQTQILYILQSDEPSLNEKGIKEFYHSILYIKDKNNRKDELQHIMHCGVMNKIVQFISPYANNVQLVMHAINILLSLMEVNQHILDYYRLMDVFYNLLCKINEESEVLQHIIEAFGSICHVDEWRHEAIKVGALQYIFSHVLEYNAIVQSVSVQTIHKFFSNFTNVDFAIMNDEYDGTLHKIPQILIKLLEKSDYYDDNEMQQQLLLTIEAFCEGTKSENRSRIILSSGCLQSIGVLLKESVKYISPKKNFDIESSCIRIIGNVLCDCIWSDFEDETVECLDEIEYLQIIHQLFNHTKLCRDILWSLSNVLISSKGISWIMTYDPIIFNMVEMATNSNNHNKNNIKLKTDAGWALCDAFKYSTNAQKKVFIQCGFVDVLLSLIGIHKFNGKKTQKITHLMERIVNYSMENKDKSRNAILESKMYESQLKYILKRQMDETLMMENFKKILETIHSGYIP